MFDILFPDTFWLLALAHFLALLSPGPDFFLLTGYAVRYRLAGSAYICVGIALGNAIYISIAIAGWSVINQHSIVFTIVQYCGAAYLFYIAIALLKSKPAAFNLTTQTVSLAKSKQCIMGLASALLNPKNALFYISLMSLILGANSTLMHQISCAIWMTMVVLVWDLSLAVIISQPKVQQLLAKFIVLIERCAGALLLVFAALMLYS
ncbi:LysE family translocator [Pseudoalteromonas mariniglutinosa]|uniref:LysE family translocator n=1 Tax=Pseudoalteromonas mariniglutinosa TaxID=206042 RepID=UPI00384FAEFD